MNTAKITQYYVCSEDDYIKNPIIPIIDKNRSVLAVVSPEAFGAGSLEGTLKLSDGRVCNVNSGWTVASPEITAALTEVAQKWYKGRVGYAGLSPSGKYYFTWDLCSSQWGVGIHNTALVPFKTVASDQSIYPFGTELTIAGLIGKTLPDGTISDGKVKCVDTGSAIIGQHLDLFVGYKKWEIKIGDSSKIY